MNKEQLEQFKNLKCEIKWLVSEIDRLERKVQSGNVVTDSVQASRQCIPFDVHTVVIEGMDQTQLERRKARFNRKLKECQKRVDEIEKWIDTVGDEQMQMILQMKIINGMKWTEIAMELAKVNKHGEIVKMPDRTTIAKKYKKFFTDSHNSRFSKV